MTSELVNFSADRYGKIGPEEPCWLIGVPDLEAPNTVTVVATVHNANEKIAQQVARMVAGWFEDRPVTYVKLVRCAGHRPSNDDLGDSVLLTKHR